MNVVLVKLRFKMKFRESLTFRFSYILNKNQEKILMLNKERKDGIM